MFADGTVALDGISFSVPEGSVFGLLGPNGAGKTTTVRLCNGMLTPTSGSVSVFGMPAAEEPARRRSSTLSEQSRMYDALSVRDNLTFYAAMYGIKESVAASRIDELVERLDAGEFADRKVGMLSTGMRKRVSLARVLVNEPEVLFLDEPTSGLDPASDGSVARLIRSLARERNATVVLCTHDLHLATGICDRFGFLDAGTLTAHGTADEIIGGVPRERTVRIHTDGGESRHRYDRLDDIDQLVRDSQANGEKIVEVVIDRPSLEDAYFHYVTSAREGDTRES